MQPWHRWREPLAVVLLVALALMLVVRGISLGLAVAGGSTGGFLGTIPGGDDLLLLTTAAAVLWCTLPVRAPAATDGVPAASAHAWPIAVAGVVVVGLTVLGWLALAVGNVVAMVTWPTPDVGFVLFVAEGVLRLVVPVAALVAVVLAVRRAAAERRSVAARPALTTSAVEREDVPAVAPEPARLPAAWQAEEATGAVWLTADDAAQGQPGLSWADPTATAGAVATGPWAPPPPAAESVPPTPPPKPPPPPAPMAAEDDDLR